MEEGLGSPEQEQTPDFSPHSNMMELMGQLGQMWTAREVIRNSRGEVVPIDHIMKTITTLREWARQVPKEQKPPPVLDKWLAESGVTNTGHLRSKVVELLSSGIDVVDASAMTDADRERFNKLQGHQ